MIINTTHLSNDTLNLNRTFAQIQLNSVYQSLRAAQLLPFTLGPGREDQRNITCH